MLDCCPLCYEKYINEDGTIDWKIFDDFYTHIPMRRKFGLGYKEDTICRCECHVKGKIIMH